MNIESVDFFYLKMPEVTNEVDGSQDALLVRIRSGTHEGWGECESAPLPTIAAWCCPKSHGVCRPVKESVLGEKLDSPEDIYRINAKVRENGLDLLQTDHTLSGVDIALWDLLARARGVSVHELLGIKQVYGKLPYASVLFGDTSEETYEKALRIKQQGFRAAKFGWNRYGTGGVAEDAAHVEAAREGLGPDGYVMIDAGTVWKDRLEPAVERLSSLAKAQVTWLEEPFISRATDVYKALSESASSVPLAAGEGCHDFYMAKDLIDRGGIDYIQIDTGRIGGISTSREVALYAQDRGVSYVNHTFTSMLALAASLAPYWDLKESMICEYPTEPKPLCRDLTKERILPDEDGLIYPPDGPGLGLVPDPEHMKKYLLDVRMEIDGQVIYETPSLDE